MEKEKLFMLVSNVPNDDGIGTKQIVRRCECGSKLYSYNFEHTNIICSECNLIIKRGVQ